MSNTNTNILTREQILGQSDLQVVQVEVPGWGGAVLIQEMTSGLRDYFEASMIADGQSGKSLEIEVDRADGTSKKVAVERFRAKLAAFSIVEKIEEEGKPVRFIRQFQPGDEDLLAQKSPRAINKIADEVLKLNAMTPDEVEEIKKDSERTTG